MHILCLMVRDILDDIDFMHPLIFKIMLDGTEFLFCDVNHFLYMSVLIWRNATIYGTTSINLRVIKGEKDACKQSKKKLVILRVTYKPAITKQQFLLDLLILLYIS